MDDASFQGVPEIVRLNFKALHDVVKAHGEALKSVEKAVANKVGRPEHTAAMQEKVSVAELTTTFEELSRVIDNKADARDTSAIVERMTSRAELQAALRSEISELRVARQRAGGRRVCWNHAEFEVALRSPRLIRRELAVSWPFTFDSPSWRWRARALARNL